MEHTFLLINSPPISCVDISELHTSYIRSTSEYLVLRTEYEVDKCWGIHFPN